MTDWKSEVINWLLLFGAIIITQGLFLLSQFFTESQGYMLRAARKLSGFLILLFAAELIIAAFFFHVFRAAIALTSFPPYLLALVVGLLTASTPTALEKIALPKTGATVEKIQKPLAQTLLKLNLALRYKFAWSIECCRQQDLYDCQQSDGWGLGLTPTEISRRFRILYEIAKWDIARARKDPSLLNYDVNRNSWEKFYLLVRHHGRRELRRRLLYPPEPPCAEWNGSERRRLVGTSADREDKSQGGRIRSYDIEDLVTAIKKGKNRRGRPNKNPATKKKTKDEVAKKAEHDEAETPTSKPSDSESRS